MTPKRLREVRERLDRLFRERDITRMTVPAIWGLVVEEAVFSSKELDELYDEAHRRLVGRVLRGDPALRRLVKELGLDDPLVRSRIQEAIDRYLEAEEAREGR
jgi:hypothetical protein